MLDGKKVKARMDELAMTGERLAELTGVSTSTISKILNNNYPELKSKLAERIAWALRMHECDLSTNPHPHFPQEGVT